MTWTLTLQARDEENQPQTLRFSLGRHMDAEDNFYDPRIQQPGLYEAGLYAGQLLQQSRSGYGETTLINTDGGLDYLADYAVDGREMVLALDGVPQVVGTVARLAFSDDEVSVVLRDPLEPLRSPHPMETYAGTNVLPNGLEGTQDDIAGEPKPLVFGEVRNAQPVLVNTALLIYQVSSLADCTIQAVYDRGVALTDGGTYASLAALQSTAPSPGEYRAYQGYVRLGSTAAGTVTVDAEQNDPRAGAVAQALATARGYTLHDDDVATLNAYGAVRLYLTAETNTLELLDRIAESIGGYLSAQADQVLRVGIWEAPEPTDIAIQDYAIATVSRSATGAGPGGLPVWQVNIGCDRIETVQSDLQSNVSEARRARLARQTRRVVASDENVRDRHPLAGEITINSVLASYAQSQAVADRVLALLSARRDTVTVEAVEALLPTVVGNLTLITPRQGYGAGRAMRVTGYRLNAQTNELTLNLWG
ncbi:MULTISPECIES: hypothetical protein [unclassified Halomonas]|uniref:hypothetical protein n=1 Tax=unclassified Halomonas TaxID=2609666 RepID=UPI00099083EE|nr:MULTISPECIES: hypothetical protein [unclassified Halomonas]AQU83254.1 hypothetical protein B2G49_12165 [Halomonas sp. 'Soap Lake \